MTKRSIIVYWLLILVPAVAICLATFKLIVHEQERINALARESIHVRARTIAETLQVTVDAVEEELQKTLAEIPENDLEAVLLHWERTNPLVRNVFVWNGQKGLVYPLPGMASTTEERLFMERFDGLFSGRIPWQTKQSLDPSAPAREASQSEEPALYDQHQQTLLKEVKKIRSSRQSLVDLAKGELPAGTDTTAGGSELKIDGGWIPWFAENRLYIMGWVRNRAQGPVYGVELELMTLLSRLVTDFPSSGTEATVYALKDDGGQILHQAGTARIDKNTVPDLVISLAPQLPHWELAVYTADNQAGPQAGGGFVLLAGLLLIIFIAAIVLGGGLLTWQAYRNSKDALQKTSFVSNVSHELKTPLTSIRMYAELLSEERVTDPEKKHRYLQTIVSETQRLTRLVNNVLDFSRLEQGQKNYHREHVDLAEYVREIATSHALRVKEAGMSLKMEILTNPAIVYTDRDAIDQIMLNLIDNAVKYASDGGALHISLESDEKRCVIRVIDKGPGVPEAHRERIFEKFHRVDDSLTARQQGSGLGLSIARRILRDLGGDIIYEPGRERGSCFVVTIPVGMNNSTEERT